MTHTPTPWAVDQYHSVVDGDGRNIAANGFASVLSYGPSMLDARENAAFIVRACNSHEKLVEALKVARALILQEADVAARAGQMGRLEAGASRITAALEGLE